jgi:uncharacterized protein (DUF2147 family)
MSRTALRKPLATLASASLLCFALVGVAHASQNTPLGVWHSIDDKTGQPRSEVVIDEREGQLSGRIVRTLAPDAKPDRVCDLCTDDRKNQPIVGMEIIRGARQAEGKSVWEGGRILDPESGKTYALRLTPADNGAKLEVRGSIGPFGRTQTWVRVR